MVFFKMLQDFRRIHSSSSRLFSVLFKMFQPEYCRLFVILYSSTLFFIALFRFSLLRMKSAWSFFLNVWFDEVRRNVSIISKCLKRLLLFSDGIPMFMKLWFYSLRWRHLRKQLNTQSLMICFFFEFILSTLAKLLIDRLRISFVRKPL